MPRRAKRSTSLLPPGRESLRRTFLLGRRPGRHIDTMIPRREGPANTGRCLHKTQHIQANSFRNRATLPFPGVTMPDSHPAVHININTLRHAGEYLSCPAQDRRPRTTITAWHHFRATHHPRMQRPRRAPTPPSERRPRPSPCSDPPSRYTHVDAQRLHASCGPAGEVPRSVGEETRTWLGGGWMVCPEERSVRGLAVFEGRRGEISIRTLFGVYCTVLCPAACPG